MELAKSGLLISVSFLLSVMVAGCGAGGPTEGAPGVVRGQVLVGPQCSVVRESEPCPDLPLSAPLEVHRALDEKPFNAIEGRVVQRLNSDSYGDFWVTLPAGSYWIIGLSPGQAPLPRPPEPILVHLDPGAEQEITLRYDSGIR